MDTVFLYFDYGSTKQSGIEERGDRAMEQTEKETFFQEVQDAELVLVGIGSEFSVKQADRESLLCAYNRLASLLQGKNYFLLTINTDDLIFESDLEKGRMVAPCGSEKTGNVVTNENYDESWYLPQWQKYRMWLQGTVNRRLCILELGVGMEYPTVIRFAFEKVAYLNQKGVMYRVHEKLAFLTPEMKDRGIPVSENAVSFVSSLQL